MATSKEYAEFIRSKFERLDVVSIKPMMGEYVIHMAGKVLGFIGDEQLMLEPGPTIEQLLPDAEKRELFPGSKLFYIIDDGMSAMRLCEIAQAIYDDLPISKPRKRKKDAMDEEIEKRFPFAKHIMPVLCCLLMLGSWGLKAQETELFKSITADLSSAEFQGRGYACNGVRRAGDYIFRQFRDAGVHHIELQPFEIDINTFPGKMEMSVDGNKLEPGKDFVMREYSPGVKGEYKLFYIDTTGYDSEKLFDELAKPENKGVFVVCDFWFTYKHKKDFRRLESKDGAPNAGVVYTWDTPLKFYKAYGEKVADKPIVWVSPDFPKDAKSIRLKVENKFLEGYRSNNVIAKISGRRHDSCYVFTAHYDHLGNLGRKLYFPGANDNASGTAAIITLAKYYAGNTPEYDMYFIAFSGEDTNLRGSTYFIEHPSFKLNSIKYLFNLDMVGDNNPVQYCEVSGPGLRGYAEMVGINAEKQLFKELKKGELAANSDHWPFAQKGVPCILFENESGDAFPYYHTAQDNMQHFYTSTYEALFKLITEFIRENNK